MSNASDFIIENGVLTKYVGPGGDVAVPEGVTSIGLGAFSGCSSLTSVTLPEGVTSIGWSAFENCSSLTSVTISDSVTSISYGAFENCSSLTSVTIPDSVTSIGDNALGSPKLTCIRLPEEWIQHAGASGLKRVFTSWRFATGTDVWKTEPFKALLNGTAQYNDALFKSLVSYMTAKSRRQSALEYIIGENRADMMERFLSFWKNAALQEIDGAIELASQSKKTEVLAVLLEYKRVHFPVERIEEITLRSEEIELGIKERTITELRELFSIYYDQDTIQISGYKGTDETVLIPERAAGRTVTEILQYAFSKDNGKKESPLIKEIVLPKTIRSIQERAFYRCVNLESIVMGSGLESLGDYAFSHCSRLKQIDIPAGVKRIGRNPFKGCSELTQISVDPENLCFASSDGVLCNKDLTELVSYPIGREGGYIPESTTTIAADAFYYCGKLTSIVIPANVATIENGAFEYCSELEKISFKPGLRKIGKDAFSGCDKLTEVILPDGLNELGEYAFGRCRSLKTVTIPGTVTLIAPSAFRWCEKLTKLSLKDGIEVIGAEAFSECRKLKELRLPASIREIGEKAFISCASLKSLVIPEGVTSIGECAFSTCKKLTSVKIPASVTKIGKRAFLDCPALTIYAPAGSQAEKYAKKNNIPFVAE